MNARPSASRILSISLVLTLLFPAGLVWGQELVVQYTGELIDEDARPLGGVLALDFKLYSAEEAEESSWQEQHYIAVVDGEYTVRLGVESPLDPALANSQQWIGVEFLGDEILRESLAMVPIIEEPAGGALAESGAGEVTFAQLADRALFAEEAERAYDCDTLSGRTIEEIDRFEEIFDSIANHQSDTNAHGGRSSGRLGSSTTVLQRVGGNGGTRYTRMCPSGYVVVGIRGGAGGFVDSLELVCAPLE